MRFPNNMARGAIGIAESHESPWMKWFAWYPASDVGVTYWLETVERRFVWISPWSSNGFVWFWEYRGL